MEGAEEGPDEAGETIEKTQMPDINWQETLTAIKQGFPNDIRNKTGVFYVRGHFVGVSVKAFINIFPKGGIAVVQQIVF